MADIVEKPTGTKRLGLGFRTARPRNLFLQISRVGRDTSAQVARISSRGASGKSPPMDGFDARSAKFNHVRPERVARQVALFAPGAP